MASERDVTYATETYWHVLFKWVQLDEFNGYWEQQGAPSYDEPIILDPFSYSYAESRVYIDFTGMIQSKGSPPIHGDLHLSDSLLIRDGSEERSLYVSGTFGPYSLSIYP